MSKVPVHWSCAVVDSLSLPVTHREMHRTGEVSLRVPDDAAVHCGPRASIRGGYIAVRYSLSLTVGPGWLDERGFIADHLQADATLRAWALEPCRISCERLGEEWSRRILALLPHDLELRELVLELCPDPFTARFVTRFLGPVRDAAAPGLIAGIPGGLRREHHLDSALRRLGINELN